MNTRLALIGLISLIPFAAAASNDEIVGTYNLVSGTRKLLDTGEVVDAYGGKHPKGSIIYSKEGRFLVMITWDGRPKPESIEKTTDQQAADLYRTMLAYGGTYDFDGKKVEHHVDMSWNELRSGTTVIRDVRKENDRLVYTTRPAAFASDGKMSVVTVVWEKVPSR
jgi:hypothetical protein